MQPLPAVWERQVEPDLDRQPQISIFGLKGGQVASKLVALTSKGDFLVWVPKQPTWPLD